MYDAIVVGARCAGAPTAMLLARKGYRVLLVDRATFPSDVMQNHVILYRGVRYLHRWGLLDRLTRTNCPPLRRWLTDFGDFPLIGFPPAEDGMPGEYAPRRYVLDKLLVDAAAEAGAELQEGCPVEGVIQKDGRVTGIRYRTPQGTATQATARIVVGADGRHSLVARAVGATTYHERPALTCGYYSYWEGTETDGMEIHVLDRPALLLAFQTNDGLACIAAQWPIGDFRAIRADIEGNLFKTLDLAPELATRVRAGRRVEHFRGSADLANFFRQAAGSGWALVGDAGVHKDPYTASGISDAFRDADLLAAAVDAGLSGRAPLDDALAAYGPQRDAAVLPYYEDTCQSAAFPPPSQEFLSLRAALRGNQQAIDRLYGVGRGIVARDDVMPAAIA
ncbi:MAG TPA: NAD(P)/FAD-dependent oxidoreductase [Ktedonobacterales bacterium]|nr:NAD(P)/FAD-dependent oxidoreductase [Ktedonobacterales bacterium]